MRAGRGARAALAAAALVLGPAAPAAADPAKNLHSLDWFVHQCLVDAASLSFYQDLLALRLEESDQLIQGLQGPADTGCCVSLDPATVSAFGTCSGGVDTDGLNVIETQGELDMVLGGGAAVGAYLVESVHYCGGFSTSIRGCASTPGDRMVVGRESEDSNFTSAVIAHERGHNAGLAHVSANPCELMAASSGGGCLSSGECSSFVTKADTTSGSCACLGDLVTDPPVANGTSCGSPCDVCSGGLCGACDEGALSRIWVAGGAGASSGQAPDDALEQSLIAGGWSDEGPIDMGAEFTGLAYDPSRDVIFAVESKAGDDDLVTLDPTTAARIATIGTLDFDAVIDDNVTALAYDPNADLLYGIHVDDEIFGGPFACSNPPNPCISSVLQIDPDTAATTELGELNTFITDEGVQGLAYDGTRDELWAAAGSGLRKIDLASCNGTTCAKIDVDTVFRRPVSLSYDPTVDRLMRQGDELGRTEYDAIDPATGATQSVRGLDPFTPGGMAVVTDFDGDGVLNDVDNCPTLANAGQADGDGDGAGDDCDNCLLVANANQGDDDDDGFGDRCDGDFDQSGATTIVDFNTWRACFNKVVGPGVGLPDDPTCAESDMDDTGIVTIVDFNLFRFEFNTAPGP